jgi:Zn-dependent metalloprotease
MKHTARCLALLLVLQGNLVSIVAQDFTDATKVERWRFSRLTRTNSSRDNRLPVSLRRLQENSQRPLDVVFGEGNVVIGADLAVASPIGQPSVSLEQSARAFLRNHLPGLSPNVAESELKLKDLPYSCEVAPTFGGKTGKTFVFERVIGGRPVIGGAIIVRVDGSGTILNVINSLAPVANRVIDKDARSLASIAALVRSKRPRLSSLVRDAKVRASIIRSGKPVLVPVRTRSAEGMVKADHIIWASGRNELQSGFLLADKTVLAPTVIPATQPQKTIPIAHIDKRTKLPTFLSYRPRGGLAVSAVGVFSDPAEIAFRYLEEHREVFRTGSPRCQFDIVDVRRSTFNPKTTFVKLGQVMAGRRVFGAELVFEIEDGNRIQTIAGHTLARVVRLDPQIAPDAARAKALQQLDAALPNLPESFRQQIRQKPITTELVVFPGELVTHKGLSKDPPTRLAYHTRSLLHGLFVDAIGGDVLYGYSLNHGANVVREAGGRTILEKPLFTEVVRNGTPTAPGTALSADAAAAVPLVTATSTFYAAHGWAGTDGTGSDMVANVNVNLIFCPNAFSPPIDEESYFCTGEVVGDIVAHELTHGVIWNSSNLIYADEPGALNESFADIMGNLAFPDLIPAGAPPGTLPGWGVGEARPGTARNMRNPALSTPTAQPGNYAGYLSRNSLGCNPIDVPGLIPPCDFGGVHVNSGINNLAYVLMSDGGLGTLVGMGRARTRMLAFDVMTLRLSSWSNFIDSALATKASCDAALASGLTDLTGAPFAQIHCDQIPGSFAAVGLDPDLFSDWIPPAVGFAGITPQFPGGQTIVNGCLITDLILQMTTPAGLFDSQASVVAGGAPLFVSYFGLMTATIAATTPPIGGTVKTHPISWTSSFGESPEVRSVVIAPITVGGNSNCRNNLITERKPSASAASNGIPFVGGTGTTATGVILSGMDPACVLVRTDVELVDGSNSGIAEVGATSRWSDVVYIAFVQVTLTQTATITAQPPGPIAAGAGNFNLSAPVAWTYSAGVAGARWRLVYTIDKPPGTTCTP